MKVFNNVTDIVRDDMATTIKRDSKVSIAAACFSMYAYKELKKQLEIADKKIEELVKTQNDMSNTIDELKSKNEELDEMVAMLLLGALDEDVSEDETIEEVASDDTETTEEVSE